MREGGGAGGGGGRGARGREREREDHEEELHERVVDGRCGGLDQKNVGIAHVLAELDVTLAVVEAAHGRLAQRDAKNIGNAFRKLWHRTARIMGACAV
jgi:hypothetical protein